jgi:hypothetical protein
MPKGNYKIFDDLHQDPNEPEERTITLDDDEADGLEEQDSKGDQGKDESNEDAADLFDDLHPSDDPPAKKKADESDEEEETDEEESNESDEDDEDEPRGSDKWRKRLARERRLKDEEREENEELRARLEAIERTVKKQASQEEFAKVKAEYDTKLADLKAQLKAALEEGNTDKQIELNEKITDLKTDLKVKEIEAQNAEKALTSAPVVHRGERLAKQWLRKHPRYGTDPEFQALVKAIDKKVASEGFDQATPEYYEELDRRVKKRFPEEYKREAPKKRRHPTQGGSDDSANARPRNDSNGFERRGNRVKLSPAQVQNMRRFGLDPDKPEDVKAYVVNNQ